MFQDQEENLQPRAQVQLYRKQSHFSIPKPLTSIPPPTNPELTQSPVIYIYSSYNSTTFSGKPLWNNACL
ncbi:hypothetical protein K505DRAFT_323450 [Melanomma pulvis-pyrius CBS 109.77]|uniref:Uncharacterized protein n=1 Tax=Melanomma pulvis-pyrius CBS 109.77 TaxID=1314802 RepID=A0A6A6XIQ2_9PLEO|nr:hypothetical protein K505DRAFT_323450 [Melanomma pulvis-pyrius CBS 109.77]